VSLAVGRSSAAIAAADEQLRASDLAGARASLVDAVRADPSDTGARMFLFQLLCVVGEWDKAEVQLRTLAQVAPDTQMLATVYGQAIAAERKRAAAFAGTDEVAVLVDDVPWLMDVATSITAFAQGRIDEAEAARDIGFGSAPDTPGEADGRRFGWIADSDARFGPAMEMILAGRWGLMPFAAIEALEFEGPSDLRDVVWMPAQMKLKRGVSAAVLVPTRYPGSDRSDDAVRLARETRWVHGRSGEEGQGQRVFSFDEGEDAGLLSLTSLRFD